MRPYQHLRMTTSLSTGLRLSMVIAVQCRAVVDMARPNEEWTWLSHWGSGSSQLQPAPTQSCRSENLDLECHHAHSVKPNSKLSWHTVVDCIAETSSYSVIISNGSRCAGTPAAFTADSRSSSFSRNLCREAWHGMLCCQIAMFTCCLQCICVWQVAVRSRLQLLAADHSQIFQLLQHLKTSWNTPVLALNLDVACVCLIL